MVWIQFDAPPALTLNILLLFLLELYLLCMQRPRVLSYKPPAAHNGEIPPSEQRLSATWHISTLVTYMVAPLLLIGHIFSKEHPLKASVQTGLGCVTYGGGVTMMPPPPPSGLQRSLTDSKTHWSSESLNVVPGSHSKNALEKNPKPYLS